MATRPSSARKGRARQKARVKKARKTPERHVVSTGPG
jgi:hypothetical protein